MSDANRTQIGIIEEATIGTTPASPAFETLRVTGANLVLTKQSTSSKELRADAQIPDRITTQLEAAGDLPQEVSYGATDTLLRGAMRSDWTYAQVRNNATAASISAVSGTAITVAAHTNAGANNYGTFAQQHLVSASGFAGAGNNRVFVAGAGTTDTNIAAAGGTIDASPAATARVKAIGFQGASGDIVATSTGLTSTALDFTTLGCLAGMWVWVGGAAAITQFATVGVAGWCRIAVGGIAAHALTFDIRPSTWGADAGTGKTISVFYGDMMINGTTRRSFTIEQQFQDLAPATYEYYRGMIPAQMEYTAQGNSIMETKTTFMGMTASIPSASRVASATDVAAPTNDVMNTSSNVGTILINGAAVSGNFVTSTAITINNTGRRNTAVGSITSVNLLNGQFMATAKLSTYYADATILTLIRNSTAASYFLPMIDPTGQKALLFDMPKVKTGDGSPTVPGINADRALDTDLEAVRHPTFGYTMSAQRLEMYNV